MDDAWGTSYEDGVLHHPHGDLDNYAWAGVASAYDSMMYNSYIDGSRSTLCSTMIVADDDTSTNNSHSSPVHPHSPNGTPQVDIPHQASTPSSPLSDLYPNSPPQYNQGLLSVELQHKPRGSQGVWKPVANKSRIRVTYGRGKNLRMIVRSLVDIDFSKLSIQLVERIDDQLVECSSSGSFSIESRKTTRETVSQSDYSGVVFVCQIDLKLYVIHKTISFRIECPGPDGTPNVAYSVEMSTHNSGRREARKNDAEDEDVDDDIIEHKAKRPKLNTRSKRSSESSSDSGKDTSESVSNTGMQPPQQDLSAQNPTQSSAARAAAIGLVPLPVPPGNRPLVTAGASTPQQTHTQATTTPSAPTQHSSHMAPPVHNMLPGGPPPPPPPPSGMWQAPGSQQPTMGPPPMHQNVVHQVQHPPQHQQQPQIPQLHPNPQMAPPPPPPPQDPGIPSSAPWQVVPGNLQVDGILRARAFLQYSDIRLKTNIDDIVDAMEIVCKLSGKSYMWKKNAPPIAGSMDETEQEGNEEENNGEQARGRRVIGLIAQEVQKVLPEVVHETEDGYLSVNYIEIIPVLIEAFKAHFKDFENFKGDLENEVQKLRKDVIGILNAEVESLKTTELFAEIQAMKARIQAINNKLGRTDSLSSLLQCKDQESNIQSSNKPCANQHSYDESISATTSSESSTTALLDSEAAHKHACVDEVQIQRHPIPIKNIEPTSSDSLSGVKVTATATTTNDKVSIQLNVVQKDRGWKLLTGLLAVLVVLAVIVALVLGLRQPFGLPSGFDSNWSANIISNPTFEIPDPSLPNRAQYWVGNYKLLSISPSALRRSFMASPNAPPLPNSNGPPESDTTDEYANTINDNYWLTIPAIVNPPRQSSKLLHLFVNTTDPNMTPMVAMQTNKPINDLQPGVLQAINVSATTYGEFVVPCDMYELDIFIKYIGEGVPDQYRINFDAGVPGWQVKWQEFDIRPNLQVESIRVQAYQRCHGHSFWNEVTVQYKTKNSYSTSFRSGA